jgi:hypothetical protein
MIKNLYNLLLLLIFLLPLKVFSQAQDTLTVSDLYGTGLYLNAIIAQDTAGTLPWHNAAQRGADVLSWQNNRRVYVLQMNGTYPANAIVVIKARGRKLKIRAEFGVPAVMGSVYKPVVSLYPASNGVPPSYFAQSASLYDTIDLKNIMITGYDEDVAGNLDNVQSGILNIGSTGSGSIFVDSCLLKSTSVTHIRTDGRTYTIRITNSLFADMGFLGKSNFGSGRALDIRDVEVDTVDIKNNTFVNSNDRIFRHYLSLMPLHNFWFNHNTVVNSLSYHGFISLGWVDSTGAGTFQIKNNLLVDHFALGCDTDVTRQVEFSDPGENDPSNNNPRMSWVLARANPNVHWDISNNYYAITDSGAAVRALAPPTYIGPKAYTSDVFLTWAENKMVAQLGGDTTATFKKLTACKFAYIPPLMTKMIRWYYTPVANGGAGKLKTGGAGVPAANFSRSAPGVWTYDFNREGIYWYHDSLDCNYKASTNLLTAGSDGKVIGSTLWTYTGSTAVDNTMGQVPLVYMLNQNYPNPFNPSTQITYQLAKAGHVSVKIFDILGREVATLVNGIKTAGLNTLTWDAAGFCSGIYLCKMQSGLFTETRKMILVK